jgi:hypothetical protein
MRIRFGLVTEGSSDRGLVDHLEALCRRAGATEAQGHAPDLGRLPTPIGKSVAEQVRTLVKLEPDIELLFIHRDADDLDDRAARSVIDRGIESLDASIPPHVKIVPIQELEAWLLLDEVEIRHVAGNPRGRQALGLPAVAAVEGTSKPKERLELALVAASGLAGQRLARFKKRIPMFRGILLQRLDIDGPVQALTSWQRLVSDVNDAVAALSHQRRQA